MLDTGLLSKEINEPNWIYVLFFGQDSAIQATVAAPQTHQVRKVPCSKVIPWDGLYNACNMAIPVLNEVSSLGIQNFCLKISLPNKGNYWTLRIGVVASYQKLGFILVKKSFF